MPVVKPIIAKESFADFNFPVGGIDLSRAFDSQPKATTPIGQNVRAFDPGTNRSRGAQREGLAKYVAARLAGLAWVVQDLNSIIGDGPPGGNMQTNSSGRVVTLVAVSQGNVYYANAGDTVWTAAVNNTGLTPPLILTGVVRSAVSNQRLYFADGVNECFYQPSTNSVEKWVAGTYQTGDTGGHVGDKKGTLPVDDGSNAPRLICTWRGRTVLSGLILDPQDWFMSAINEPDNFDYSPLSTTPAQAVAGNNAPQGLVGDVLTALVPYNDDILIFGGDHSIYLMHGDPMAGGQIDLVSDIVGMAFGIPWAKDPYGNVYFVSNRMGIYSLVPGQPPVRISQQIEQLLQDVDTGSNTIRLVWNDRFQGLHVFITPTSSAGAATHFFFEQRTGAWWQDTFADNNMNPLAVTIFDGNTPTDRVALIGSWDGYVRAISPTAADDDGTPIASAVVLGPILTKDLDDMLLKDLQAVLSSTSGDVTFAVYVGTTAEIALASTPVITGTWSAGRNLTNMIRRAGHAVYVKITATNAWAMESIRARIAGTGKVRRRGF